MLEREESAMHQRSSSRRLFLKAGAATAAGVLNAEVGAHEFGAGDRRRAAGLPQWEAVANGDAGGARGRELEFVELLSFLKQRRVRNVVWLTADVHYCAAHFYDPSRAAFGNFDPFWEFVAGPLNGGSFGPAHSTARSDRRWCSSRRRRPDRATCPPSAGCSSLAR
jgi:phosphodiesterase/alkaline phosphatase D-like protein